MTNIGEAMEWLTCRPIKTRLALDALDAAIDALRSTDPRFKAKVSS